LARKKYYNIPDVRDGLTELERTILFTLHELKKEYGERHVPVILVYGRVVEYLDVTPEEFQLTLTSVQERSMPIDRYRKDEEEEHE
jgi:hypothetical protein